MKFLNGSDERCRPQRLTTAVWGTPAAFGGPKCSADKVQSGAKMRFAQLPALSCASPSPLRCLGPLSRAERPLRPTVPGVGGAPCSTLSLPEHTQGCV